MLRKGMIKKILVFLSIFFFGVIISEVLFYSKYVANKPPSSASANNKNISPSPAAVVPSLAPNPQREVFDDIYRLLGSTGGLLTVEYGGTLKKVHFDFPSANNPKERIPLLLIITAKEGNLSDLEVDFTQEDLNQSNIRDESGKPFDYKKLAAGQTVMIKVTYDSAKNIYSHSEITVTSPKK